MDRRILCPVLDDDLPAKEAEAIRLVREVAGTYFLDFLHVQEARVRVVMRFRMPRESLAAVRDRLRSDVLEFRPEMVN